MAYEVEISRVSPTCFLFLIDQSTSMLGPIMGVPGNQRKADFIAEALNKVIQNLVVLASKDEGVRKYFQIGVIGYGNTVRPALGGIFGERNLVWIDEIADNPLRIEDIMKKESDGAGGFIEVDTKFPVWIDPIANGDTPMCEALRLAESILNKWASDNQLSYPPTVINLTDGEANDGDPRESADDLKSINTSDGNAILMTLHASSNPYSEMIFFPHHNELLPDDPSRLMFEMTSKLTPSMHRTASEVFKEEQHEDAKGMVYNADIAGIIQALDIGTRPANLR